MQKQSRIYVAGHAGLVGSAIVRRLQADGCDNLLLRTHKELDLTDQRRVNEFLAAERPEVVILAAARVGGIQANKTYPAEFIRENLLIQTNVIDAAWRAGAKQFLFLGSSCMYPRLAPQPIHEQHLMGGPLEPTNEAYALAKLAGMGMAQAYRRQYGFRAICVIPTNLYGPGDNFDPQNSHVVPALIRKFHEAKTGGARDVTLWGTGKARREFLHVDDLADAACFLLRSYDAEEIINVGAGTDLTVGELAALIADVVGFRGEIRYDATRPDGMPRKQLDASRVLALGWRPRIALRDGIEETYRWFQEHGDKK